MEKEGGSCQVWKNMTKQPKLCKPKAGRAKPQLVY